MKSSYFVRLKRDLATFIVRLFDSDMRPMNTMGLSNVSSVLQYQPRSWNCSTSTCKV